jgi:CheY-like chemotaxis protein
MHDLTVVVVDDDRDIRYALAEVLSAEGYPVRLATNGQEGLASIRELGLDRCLVLLDMAMPTMNGEELLAILRDEGHLPALPVVVLSASKPTFAATAGARLCLHKPIDLDVLLRVLERLCDGRDRPSEASDASCTRLRTTAPATRPLAKCAEGEGDAAPTTQRQRGAR